MRRALLLCAVLGACGWDFNRMNNQPRCEPLDRRPWLPDERCDQSPPANTVTWHAAAAPPDEPAPTRTIIARGADRFTRFCSPCHGTLGNGVSAVASDMRLRPPASLLDERIVKSPDKRLYEVITSGYGMMPSYAYQVAPPDRWAIVHYIRVLERSQAMPLDRLPQARRQEVQRWLP